MTDAPDPNELLPNELLPDELLPDDERRQSPRHSFGVVQQVAELVDGKMPSTDAFQRVQILDLSCEGFSFYTLAAPENKDVVVVMGNPPDLLRLPARIVYCKLVEQYGHNLFRIGCRFSGDTKLDAVSVVLQQRSTNDHMMQQLEGLADLPDCV